MFATGNLRKSTEERVVATVAAKEKDLGRQLNESERLELIADTAADSMPSGLRTFYKKRLREVATGTVQIRRWAGKGT